MKSESNDLISSDIDECAMKTSNCDSDARCTNTEGSFNCSCNRGYQGDGLNCTGTKLKIISIEIHQKSYINFAT